LRNTVTNPDGDSYGNIYTYANSYSNGYCDGNINTDANGHGDIHANSYGYRNVYAYTHGYGHVHANGYGYSDIYTHGNSNSYVYSDGYSHGNIHANVYTDGDGDSYSYSHGYCYRNTHGNRDSYGHGDANCYSDRHANSGAHTCGSESAERKQRDCQQLHRELEHCKRRDWLPVGRGYELFFCQLCARVREFGRRQRNESKRERTGRQHVLLLSVTRLQCQRHRPQFQRHQDKDQATLSSCSRFSTCCAGIQRMVW
jgi:hypothetical protein